MGSRFERYRAQAQQFGAWTVLFQQAAANRLGLTPTELETFRLVQHEGLVTASALAKQTGLTPASMSAIVDKLVGGEFFTREQDSSDRRRWLLKPAPGAAERVDGLYAAHARRFDTALDAYSDREFDVILGFLSTLTEELRATTVELGLRDKGGRAGTRPGPPRAARSGVPRALEQPVATPDQP